jgi:hypothetical protein
MNQQHGFARILGRAPRCKVLGCVTEYLDIFVDAFGPPEILKCKSTKLLFWNFARDDGENGFSLLVPVNKTTKGEIQVDISSNRRRDFEAFMSWTLDQMSSASNGEESPRFLNGADFVVVPA